MTEQIIKDVLNQPGLFSEDEIIEVLQLLDDVYHNTTDGEVLATDADYDRLRKFAEDRWPSNGYFRQIGSAVHGNEIKHAMPIAGLNQLYTEDEVDDWILKHDVKIAVISSKLDGGSGTLTYVKGKLISGATRGDGITGKDITRHVKQFTSILQTIKLQDTIDIRGELIISKANFPKVQELLQKLTGRVYKNARNTITGLINSKEIPVEVFPYLDFVAYDVAGYHLDKIEIFHLLEKLGFKVAEYCICDFDSLVTMLPTFIKRYRNNSEYDCDGIVTDVNDADAREELMPTEDDLTPGYAFKWKVNDAVSISTVIGVEWKDSAYCYLKPVVLIEPVDMQGVTVGRLTGYNAKFIYDNKVGIGAQVSFVRAGDVIPDIQEVVVQAAEPLMPAVAWDWNETEVDAVAIEDTPRAQMLQELLRRLRC